MTDELDKLAGDITDRIVKDCDGIENAWNIMNDQERGFFKQFITAGMKLQQERDAVIAESCGTGPCGDCCDTIAQSIRTQP